MERLLNCRMRVFMERLVNCMSVSVNLRLHGVATGRAGSTVLALATHRNSAWPCATWLQGGADSQLNSFSLARSVSRYRLPFVPPERGAQSKPKLSEQTRTEV